MSSPLNNTNNNSINQNQIPQPASTTSKSSLASIATVTQQSAASVLNLPQSNTPASIQQPQAPVPPVFDPSTVSLQDIFGKKTDNRSQFTHMKLQSLMKM